MMKEISIHEKGQALFPDPLERAQHKEDQGGAFVETLKTAMGEVNKLHAEADKAVQELSTGENTDIHNTMIALEKAEVSFQMMMQVRNKIISAYETIMRMNI